MKKVVIGKAVWVKGHRKPDCTKKKTKIKSTAKRVKLFIK